MLCEVVEISRQAYNKQQNNKQQRLLNEEMVRELVREIRRKMPMIGCKKLYRMLKCDINAMGLKLGRDALFDILRQNDMLIKPKKKYTKTTNSYHHFRIYKNLIKGKLLKSPNEVFVSDITYIRLSDGFSYLFLITDLYSRKIVGYDLSVSLGVEGALRALKMALRVVDDTEGIIHHSDRGIQYCCNEYTGLLRKRCMKISMGDVGNPYDNAVAERVNGILKIEFLLDCTFETYGHAKKAVKEAINTYNTLRPHSSIGFLTPNAKYAA
jgi:transposase InsO family protein